MEDTTLHNLKAPWLKLHKLSNDTSHWSKIVDDFYDAVGAVENFEDIGSNEVSLCVRDERNKIKKSFSSLL